jgi:AcrR family transcriptional regulator
VRRKGLRADQVDMTRRRILETVVELSADPDAGPLTVAEVARRSGVAPATIYRHFPRRDDLISAAAHARVLLGVTPGVERFGAGELRAHLLALWSDLARNLALTRQASLSDAGRELRQARFDALAPAHRAALSTAGVDPDAEDVASWPVPICCRAGTRCSTSTTGRGSPVEEAVEAVAWGTEALLRTIGLEPDDFSVPMNQFATDPGEEST